MTNLKEKEHWYYHEMIVCTGIVLVIFSVAYLLMNVGLSSEKIGIIIGGIFLCIILLPLIDPVKDFIKWINKRKTDTQESQS